MYELILWAYFAAIYCFSSALWFQSCVLTVRMNDFHKHAYNYRIKNEVNFYTNWKEQVGKQSGEKYVRFKGCEVKCIIIRNTVEAAYYNRG
jgi:hypothetical protein